MSEQILKALLRLFALISDVHDTESIAGKGRDIVRLFLSRHLNNELVIKYMEIFDGYFMIYHSEEISRGSMKEKKRTSLTAMKILAICERINEQLHHKQKVYVIVQLIDFILFSSEVTEKELDFLDTVSAAFNIQHSEYHNIKSFILNPIDKIPESNNVLIIDDSHECEPPEVKHIYRENLKGRILLLHILSINTYIMRYAGKNDIYLNGQNVFPGQTYPFDNGSIIRSLGINTIYFNDVNTIFTEEAFDLKISVDASDLNVRFKNSENGIQDLNFSEESGNLVGIMGGSGVGKSTLLNVLSGRMKPQSGEVLINGYNLYLAGENKNLDGVIGFVPQDDLLIEELSVFQNLYYNARMCLDNLSESDLEEAVKRTLTELDLYEIRNLKVGSILNKIISGGQRKRLNIALELIREPTILFVDEPTSGLSSVDSEIVMNLLKEQTYRGKLVIINIHQPGSDIYKMFDKIMIIDRGGYLIFYGNPAEAIVYFKTKSSRANAGEDRCFECGNVDTDQLLQIIEAKVIDENGKPTQIRRVSPREWAERYHDDFETEEKREQHGKSKLPENQYSIPGILKQSKIYFIRDILKKLANRQYVLINLLFPPLLALLLAYFTKYVEETEYLFIENENLPVYLFMCVITSLFLGLIFSAEEIVKDRKILMRESFLNLSWFSYLNSKIAIMFLISAIQAFSFIIIGNSILEIKGMTLSYWIILFTTSCCSNMLGLNISSAFKSVITIYILIPFVIIPQLLFSGALVKFDSLHKSNISSVEFVPVIGEVMPARWAFEALAVEQFKNNSYERNFFNYNVERSQNDWYANFLIPDLKTDLDECLRYIDSQKYNEMVRGNFFKLNFFIDRLTELSGLDMIPGAWKASLNEDSFSSEVEELTKEYLDSLTGHFNYIRNKNMDLYDSLSTSLNARIGEEERIHLMNEYHNTSLEELVKESPKDRTYETQTRIIQKFEPIYMKPVAKYGRAHFYAPYKQIGNIKIDTFWFNVIVLWLFTLVFYIALYFNLLHKAGAFFENLRLSKSQVKD